MPLSHPGETIFVIAGGPSVTQEAVDALRGRPVIAINSSYERAPWCDYVFAMDYRWVRQHRPVLERDFRDRVITTTRMQDWPGLLRVQKILKPGLTNDPKTVACAKTSLTGGITVARHMTGPGGGIVLLGADGCAAADGRTHHHTPHKWKTQPTAWANQAGELQALARPLKELGIKVFNANPKSKWAHIFPTMPLDEILRNEAECMDRTERTYREIFDAERAKTYPAVDALEVECGSAISRGRLEAMARVLACPLKVNPPNWQHGRVIYAIACKYLVVRRDHEFRFVDIGTAKGFSAICMAAAIVDSGKCGQVTSVDVIDPLARERRNSVAELEGAKTLAELIAPFWEDRMGIQIDFRKVAGMTYLAGLPRDERINFAFIDGKHKTTDVREEAKEICHRQIGGDIMIFDDVNLPSVAAGLATVKGYDIRFVDILPNRRHAIAIKK